MLNVNELIKRTMKKEIFSGSELENKSARNILSEIKTKYIDIKSEITAEVQYKIVKKMLSDRNKAIEIYRDANREDLLAKEVAEANVCSSLIKDLEEFLPKQMTEEEIKNKISEIISSNDKANIGIIMKEFAGLNADKSVVSRIAKELISSK